MLLKTGSAKHLGYEWGNGLCNLGDCWTRVNHPYGSQCQCLLSSFFVFICSLSVVGLNFLVFFSFFFFCFHWPFWFFTLSTLLWLYGDYGFIKNYLLYFFIFPITRLLLLGQPILDLISLGAPYITIILNVVLVLRSNLSSYNIMSCLT